MNNQNLKPFTSEQSREEAVKNGKKGGIASGQARRERKAVQALLNDFLDLEVSKSEKLSDLAKQYGVTTDSSIKELVTAVCVINTLENGTLKDLKILAELLGEVPTVEDKAAEQQEHFLEAIRTAVITKGGVADG